MGRVLVRILGVILILIASGMAFAAYGMWAFANGTDVVPLWHLMVWLSPSFGLVALGVWLLTRSSQRK
ncbi:MAG: hypothetical protein JJ884_10450 [Maricaulis sp.]|uniref:hypothetical protein n=1 Tax=Maricaulis sp. TaxID=1486257 RepID=UPI001B160F95|nr:hypothetical protein [Maricaulis sp.]MBO6728888.1 hypothetical protein [Maricaulis sp.]MBO6847926.1 hypothetical protein [Maricaulis sp.]MBO6877696.1 hypothetical protein [Maricaulis sp.]